jgi:hypothetical protein
MPKRFLNVLYGGVHARIDTKDMEDLSQVQKEVKSFYGDNIPGAASQIQFYNKENIPIDDLNDIPVEYYKKRKEGGLELVIRLIPVKQSRNFSMRAEEYRPFKKQCIE